MTSDSVVVEWVPGPQKTSFYTKFYSPSSPPKAIIIFLHGFIEHIDRYTDIFPLWASKGVAVVAFDQRGFGKTGTDKEHNKDSGYGKTCTAMQIEDLDFMIEWTRGKFGNLGEGGLFLMGHSMGGAIALAYCTQTPPRKGLTQLKGVISTSPLLKQAVPAPKWKRLVGGLVSKLSSWSNVPAAVNASELSHDPKVGEAYLKDPLVIQHGTLRGVSTMLDTGDDLMAKEWKHWPKDLPLLVIHGNTDKVTSHDASSKFVNSLSAKDKTFTTYEGGYHELHNEPNGVREKLVDECVSWVLAHLSTSSGKSVDAVDVAEPAKL